MAHKGVLLVAVGMRYKGYCANVGRTFVVDPTKVRGISTSKLTFLYLSTGSRSRLCTTRVITSGTPS